MLLLILYIEEEKKTLEKLTLLTKANTILYMQCIF